MSDSEALLIFSDDWARACALVLNQGEGYRAAAATWEAIIVLTMTEVAPKGGERRVLLDLFQGACRAARAGNADDETGAHYVMSGSELAWRQVLTGTVPPLMAIMTGKIRLAKGNLMELLPYVSAARELVMAAAKVPTSNRES
ncbi:MAG TPA: SCP2 sterol-binding domain-containing protein [Gemmatimonadales bacterium]|nr:SCP2 sterol-binding domain-containing protein [Gemmatimonadales bacterium]